uniref:Deoxyribonuclease tatdn3-A isoform X3 n=1 Tax=Geotrypetes seraphini TaxID=260995 RepID=A0A6P8QYR1_GEOSA|nr:putative deoxyribonuclease tatdn3-A isoform X3 [Geotrypetes seraphini]
MASGFIDCHCHMTAIEFQQDVDVILEKSREAGVTALISVTEHVDEFERVLDLSERYPGFVMPCFGIHPVQSTEEGHHSVRLQDLEPVLSLFEKFQDKLVAIGEIGLDFTPWLASTSQEREEQKRVFQVQLEVAKKFDLPVNVHSRSAGRQTISFLKEQEGEVNPAHPTGKHLPGNRLPISWAKPSGKKCAREHQDFLLLHCRSERITARNSP